MTSIRELAAHTPVRRERYLDLLRAIAITAVVLGHWLVVAIEHDSQGRLTGTSALGPLSWSHPATWLFQVMPIFFIVGGFANAASLTSHRRRNGDTAGWLLDRSARLVRPTTVLLVGIGAAALASRLLGADPAQVGRAAWLMSLPLWFLVAYLGMIVLTPVMHALHRRAGLTVPLLLVVPVVAGDVLRFRYGVEELAYGSFLFGWLAIHQLGFAWRDGRLPPRPQVAVPLLAGGVAALLALTVFGPYPVSMVTVPGETMQNSSPPSLALLALAAAQLGLALLLRGPGERWLQRRRPWTVVVAVNSVVLTVFLWHMAAVVLVALVLSYFGVLPTPPVDSPQWLLWQLPWLAILAVTLAGLVALFGRVEARAGGVGRVEARVGDDGRSGRGGAGLLLATVAGYTATIAGLLWQAVAGDADHGPFALPTGALALFLAGAGVLRLLRWAVRTPAITAGRGSAAAGPVRVNGGSSAAQLPYHGGGEDERGGDAEDQVPSGRPGRRPAR